MAKAKYIDTDEIAAQLEGELAPNATLSNVLRFLGRPAFAARSLLRGDLEGAGRNVAQFFLDLPGGFLNRNWSLAHLVPGNETGDLTTWQQRPEFEDLLKSWGGEVPTSAGGRFAANLLGGILTDPLTPLTFGGGGVARGALQGLGREAAASTLMQGLQGTRAGRGILAGLDAAAEPAAALERALGLSAGKLGTTTALEEGQLLEQLVKGGQLVDPTALRVGERALVPDIWPKLGSMTAPGLAYQGLKRVSPASAEGVAKLAGDAWDFVKGNFYDRKLAGHVPEGLRQSAVDSAVETSFRQGEARRGAAAAAQTVPEGELQEIGRRMTALQDEWAERSFGKGARERAPIELELQARLEQGLSPAAVEAVRSWQGFAKTSLGKLREVEKAKAWRSLFDFEDADAIAAAGRARGLDEAGAQALATDVQQAQALLRGAGAEGAERARELAKVADELERQARFVAQDAAAYRARVRPGDEASSMTAAAAEGDAARAAKAATEARDRANAAAQGVGREDAEKALGELRGRLAERGIGLDADSPFYFPRQLRDEVAEKLPRGAGLFQASSGVKTVFQKRRKYETAEDLAKAIREATGDVPAGQLAGGEDLAAAATELAGARGIDDVLETNLAKVWLRYGEKVASVIGRGMLEREAKKIGARYGLEATELDRYVARQFDPLEKAGAKPIALQALLRTANKYYKPALTVQLQNPSFHVGNAISNVVQTGLDADLGGLEGAKALLGLIRNAPAIRAGAKIGLDADQAQLLMRASDGDQAARAAIAELQVGKLKGDELLRLVDGVIGGRAAGSADLFDSIGMAQKLGIARSDATALGRAWDWWTDLGTRTGNYIEHSFRVHALLALLAKGVAPTKAVQRVNRIYVDYTLNSALERGLRDALPFVKYSMSILPPAAEGLARRPGGVLAQVLRTAQGEMDREPQGVLPEGITGRVSIPLGGMSYLSGLRLPQEGAAGLVDSLPIPGQGLGERLDQLLAQAQPLAKAPFEIATGEKLGTDMPWGAGRPRVPGFLPELPGERRRVGAEGEAVRELPGWLGEAIAASPLSRFASTIRVLADEQRPLLDRVTQVVVGPRKVTLDERQATARALTRYFERLAAKGDVVAIRRWWPRIEKGELPEELRAALEADEALKKAR